MNSVSVEVGKDSNVASGIGRFRTGVVVAHVAAQFVAVQLTVLQALPTL